MPREQGPVVSRIPFWMGEMEVFCREHKIDKLQPFVSARCSNLCGVDAAKDVKAEGRLSVRNEELFLLGCRHAHGHLGQLNGGCALRGVRLCRGEESKEMTLEFPFEIAPWAPLAVIVARILLAFGDRNKD